MRIYSIGLACASCIILAASGASAAPLIHGNVPMAAAAVQTGLPAAGRQPDDHSLLTDVRYYRDRSEEYREPREDHREAQKDYHDRPNLWNYYNYSKNRYYNRPFNRPPRESSR